MLFASGQLRTLREEMDRRYDQLNDKLPRARRAAIRCIARDIRRLFADSLLWLDTSKRKVFAAMVLPAKDEGGAFIRLDSIRVEAGTTRTNVALLAHLHAHAIGRMLQRRRDVSLVRTLAEEMRGDDVFLALLYVLNHDHVGDFALGTVSGQFRGDVAKDSVPILRTWIANRTLRPDEVIESGALRLRKNEQADFAP